MASCAKTIICFLFFCRHILHNNITSCYVCIVYCIMTFPGIKKVHIKHSKINISNKNKTVIET